MGGIGKEQYQKMCENADVFNGLVRGLVYGEETQAEAEVRKNVELIKFITDCWGKGTVDVEGADRKTIGACITKYITKSDMQRTGSGSQIFRVSVIPACLRKKRDCLL